jgi:hypothetical protein
LPALGRPMMATKPDLNGIAICEYPFYATESATRRLSQGAEQVRSRVDGNQREG